MRPGCLDGAGPAAAALVPFYGRDGQTGETLVKSALEPLFPTRTLEVLAWHGVNLLGGGDGHVLDDPRHKRAKVWRGTDCCATTRSSTRTARALEGRTGRPRADFARVSTGRLTMREPMIVSDPKVMMGKPVVEGTRITVELILEKLGGGESMEQVLESHPRLTREGVLAALRFAAQALRAEVVYPVGMKPA